MDVQTSARAATSTRLRFVLGRGSTEVALPTQARLTDLLPAVLPQFGAEWIELGADHEGWIAQRVGEQPLDEDRTLAELGLFDGETVYLRPRADQLAPIDYDDLVDGVGEQVREHGGQWQAGHTRWTFRLGASATLLVGLLLLSGIGEPQRQALVALTVAGLLLGGAALAARAAADPSTATVLAGLAACYAGAGGQWLVHASAPLAEPPTAVTGGLAAALLALSVGAFLVADAGLLFTGAIVFVIAVGITGLIASVTSLDVRQAVSAGLVVCLVGGVFLPATAFRLAGLTLPMLPSDAPQLGEDIDPVPARLVVERGTATVGYSTALHVGLGAALTVLLLVLVAGGDGWDCVLSLVVAALLVLRTRHPSGVVQRCSILVPAVVALALNVVQFAAGRTGTDRLTAVFLPLFLGGLLLLLFSRLMPGRRLRPYWGRAVEVLESVTAIAVVPVVLQVLGVYAYMRGLAG